MTKSAQGTEQTASVNPTSTNYITPSILPTSLFLLTDIIKPEAIYSLTPKKKLQKTTLLATAAPTEIML